MRRFSMCVSFGSRAYFDSSTTTSLAVMLPALTLISKHHTLEATFILELCSLSPGTVRIVNVCNGVLLAVDPTSGERVHDKCAAIQAIDETAKPLNACAAVLSALPRGLHHR